jgi:hypothetical protein
MVLLHYFTSHSIGMYAVNIGRARVYGASRYVSVVEIECTECSIDSGVKVVEK